MEELKYCTYCGDELSDREEEDAIHNYYKEFGNCPHWDDQNRPSEF